VNGVAGESYSLADLSVLIAWCPFGLPSVADHLDTITQGGGWSFRMWFSSGIVVPHDSAPICRPLPLIVSQPRERNVGTRAATR
jgi:hypothetical protein